MYSWLRRMLTPSQASPASPGSSSAGGQLATPEAAGRQPAADHKPHASSAITWLQRSDIDAAFTNWLFKGNDYSDIFTNQLEKDILGALDKIVKSKQSGVNLVRRMPGVIPQLLQSLRTEDFSGAQLARKISHDVVLVAAVIRIANSSFYSPAKSITSIEHAVLVLGQAGLRQLITSVAFQPIIDLNCGHFTKMVAPLLWEQSEKCAVANRILALEAKVDPFESFLAGLIQNVGLIVSLRLIDQMYDGKQSIGSESFCNSLISYGRKLSCSIGREWHFPDSVTGAIAEQGIPNKNAGISAIGKILMTGDYLSKMHMLDKNERLYGHLANFNKHLSAHQNACLDALNSVQESEI